MRFADIPGLEDVKEKLYHAIASGQVAHAQLFMGNPGSANLALALAYATLLNCSDPQLGDACGKCPSCQKNSRFIHPDVHFVFPVSPVKNISGKDVVSDSFIAEWRTFLQSNIFGGPLEWSSVYGGENKQLNISKEESRNIIRGLSLKAFEGNYKIMLIWLPEYLHPSAANAILKILEEPPEKTLFLLVTNDYEQLIGTIISRTQLVQIRSFDNKEVMDFLEKNHNMPPARAGQIAQIVDGDMNEAIRMAISTEDDSHQMFREWMRQCYAGDYTKLVEWSDKFGGMNKISQKGLLQYGLNVLRESLMMSADGGQLMRLSGEGQDFVKNFSKVLNLKTIEGIAGELNQAYYHLERNASAKIVFLDTSIAIGAMLKAKNVD